MRQGCPSQIAGYWKLKPQSEMAYPPGRDHGTSSPPTMLGGVVVALAVEMTGTGQLTPGLKMLGNSLVEQSALGVARVVEFGLCSSLPARMRMSVRWACSGGHGAVPAWAGCSMVLSLYPVSPHAEASVFSQNISQFPSMALCSPLESFPAEIPMTPDATMRRFNHKYFWKLTVRRSIFGPTA